MFEELSGVELVAALTAGSDPVLPGDGAGGPDLHGAQDGLLDGYLAGRVERIAGWERVLAWAHGMQAVEVAALAAGRAAEETAAGVRSSERGRFAGTEVALARRVSPTAGDIQVAFARQLVGDHPATLAGMLAGRISVMAARALVRESAVLGPELRREVDAAAAVEAAELTPGQVARAVARRVVAADPAAAEDRAGAARAERRVAVLPDPDGTAALWARLPAEQAVACRDALDAHARGLRAGGDPRPLQHLMCDTLVQRLTGAASADRLPVQVGVVLSAATLLGLDSVPATLHGYGALPAGVARRLATSGNAWLRRLIVDPIDGRVLTIDTRRRRFDGRLRKLIIARDQTCRGPGCTGTIRDIDHLLPHAAGGPTTATNSQGLCPSTHACRHHPGWRVTTSPDPAVGGVEWTTPTGHRYQSRPPPALGHGSHTREQLLARRLRQ